jgi:RNA polymerase sigma-70 factor (ECF subfamily)
VSESTDPRELLRRAGQGDETALTAFYEGHIDRLYSFIYWRAGADAATAEDLTQETLIAALASLRRYDGRAEPFTWLCGIARHKIADHYRRLQRFEIARSALLQGTAPPPSPDDQALASERQQMLAEALRRLPVRYQQVLLRKYVDHLSTKAIARELGVSERAADSLLTRARAALRHQLTVSEEAETEYGQDI